MTRDRPEPARLLDQTLRTFQEELLGNLPKEQRFTGLMIANGLAIALRDMAGGAEAEARDLTALRRILPDLTDADLTDTDLATLEAELAKAIRAGRRDGDAATHALLFESTLRRLRIANPKLLEREGLGP